MTAPDSQPIAWVEPDRACGWLPHPVADKIDRRAWWAAQDKVMAALLEDADLTITRRPYLSGEGESCV